MNDLDRTLFNTPPRWHGQRTRHGVPAELARWLFDPGSLTRRLRQCCTHRFRVGVLRQGWCRPSCDEARALRLRLGVWVWGREVQLLCGDQPWVFARTLIPPLTLRGRGRRLTQLGNRPLGEMLFADPNIQRGSLEIARIVTGQRLYQRACADVAQPPEVIWGRRSIFHTQGQPLLVCELFLPNLPTSPPFADRIGFYHEHRPL